MNKRNVISIFSLAAMSVAAQAQVIVNGTAEPEYGAPASTQNVETSFGDSNIGDLEYATGSELDVAYATIRDGKLYVVLAGNLESNFNKLEMFIDCKPGGQNVMRNDNPDVSFNGLNRLAGLTFDSGFEPDYWFSITGGGLPYTLYANFAELLSFGGGQGYYMGSAGAVSDGSITGGNNPFDVRATINNSNTGGVLGGTGASSGAGVTTGLEYAIPLAAIGNPVGKIRISAYVNGVGHDFLSNQVLGGCGAGQDHLGDPLNVNFNNVPGNQDFTAIEGTSASSLTVLSGEEFSGDLSSMMVKDGASFEMFNDATTLNASVQLDANLPGMPTSQVTLALEHSAARPGLQIQVQMRRSNGSYQFAAGATEQTGLSTLYVTKTTVADWVGSSNEVGAIVSWSPINDEDPAQDGWLHSIDALSWMTN
ncbi:MAG TPA: hypothetical protein PKA27_09185 [Fimbriimonadaceae bacterium]|nr:hypothetical protein [Fimbriimonadaceae bacterium]